MRIFISGGCKNGKSMIAQKLAQAQSGRPLYYVATMAPVDGEDDKRILRHKADRDGWGFETVEMPTGIDGLIKVCDAGGSLLLDSLTALLMNEMFPPSGITDSSCSERLAAEIDTVCRHFENIVIVSDAIYSDAGKYTDVVEDYRRSLAFVDRAAAKACDAAIEVCFSTVVVHKRCVGFDELYEKID